MYSNKIADYRKIVTDYISKIANNLDLEYAFLKFIKTPADKRKLDRNAYAFAEIENALVYEAEKHARENPLLALMFLSFTTKNVLSEAQLKRREAILEYCLLRVRYEDINDYPFWVKTKYANLHAKERDALTIDVDENVYIHLFRHSKTYIWDFEIYHGEELKAKGTFPLFVLSSRKIRKQILKSGNVYNVYISTPFVEFLLIISHETKNLVDWKLVLDKRANKNMPAKIKLMEEEQQNERNSENSWIRPFGTA